MTLHDTKLVVEAKTARSSTIGWRRLLLLQRAALLRLWPQYFPEHSFADLRRTQPTAKPLPPVGWDEHWAEAASAYRQERGCSSWQALGEAVRNACRKWVTPQSTVEAILLAVRERGIAALEELDTAERLSRCDAAAHEQINRRIAALKG